LNCEPFDIAHPQQFARALQIINDKLQEVDRAFAT
jgi:hypothetical protein